MKQYRITTDNIIQDSPDDAYLAPEDPIHELKAAAMMGGLGAQERLAEYKSKLKPQFKADNRAQIQRDQGIKPGTPAWFELWFGKNNK